MFNFIKKGVGGSSSSSSGSGGGVGGSNGGSITGNNNINDRDKSDRDEKERRKREKKLRKENKQGVSGNMSTEELLRLDEVNIIIPHALYGFCFSHVTTPRTVKSLTKIIALINIYFCFFFLNNHFH